MRCLHLADLHLGYQANFLGEKATEYRLKRDGLLSRVTRWALEPHNQIDLVLIVGDLFDNHRPPTSLVESVIADLQLLVQAGKTVITVPGNHDEITYHDSVFGRQRQRWPGHLVTNPLPEAPTRLTVKGQPLFLYSLAYTGGLTRVKDYLELAPRTSDDGIHLAAIHGSLDWPGEERSLPLDSNRLAAAGYDYVALGHFHQTRYQKKGQVTMGYAGCIEGKGFSDPACAQLTVVDLAPGEANLSFVPWETCRTLRTEILNLDRFLQQADLEEAIRALADGNLMLKVELAGTSSFLINHEQLVSRLERGFYHLEIENESLHLADELLSQWAAETTIRGRFVERLLKKLAEATDERQRQVIQLALRQGMAAFLGGGQ